MYESIDELLLVARAGPLIEEEAAEEVTKGLTAPSKAPNPIAAGLA